MQLQSVHSLTLGIDTSVHFHAPEEKAILLFYWNTELVGVDDLIQKHDTCNVEDRADKEKVACFSEKEVRRLSRNGYQSE